MLLSLLLRADRLCLIFGLGDWICKACASKLGLKTGIAGHEWDAKESVDKQEDQSSSQDEDNGNELVDSDDEEVPAVDNKEKQPSSQDEDNGNELVDSDDEEVPVRRKKRRKVIEDSDSDDE